MLYLFKHLIRLCLLLTLLALLLELVPHFKEGWETGPQATLEKVYQSSVLFGSRLAALDLKEMTWYGWARWIWL